MNMNLSDLEVLDVLLRRIQLAKLPIEPVSIAQRYLDITSLSERTEVSQALLALIGHSWQHHCEAENVVRVPLVVVVPCDLSGLFAPLSGSRKEFSLVPPAEDIKAEPYFLCDVVIAHAHRLTQVVNELQKCDWRELTLLESAQLLAQTLSHRGRHNHPTELGLGSMTTRNLGLHVDSPVDKPSLHVHFRGYQGSQGMVARPPTREVRGFDERQHHIALCRKIIDPVGARNRSLGTLHPIPA